MLKAFLTSIAACVVLSATSLSHADSAPFNCNTLWTYSVGSTLNCQESTTVGFPMTIGGAQVHMYHYSDGWTGEMSKVELMAALQNIASSTIGFYTQFWKMPRIDFVLLNQQTEHTYAEAHWVPAGNPNSCRINIFLNMPSDRDLAMQIGAHEIFHCAQAYNLKYPTSGQRDGNYSSWSWWAEGSATAWSSRAAPNGRQELKKGAQYAPDQPLYHQPNPYATTVFWDDLFINQGMSVDLFGSLIKSLPAASTFAGERAALSAFPNIDSLFHKFARSYSAGQIYNITHAAYSMPAVGTSAPIDFDATLNHLDVPVTPFVIQQGALRFPSGTRVRWGLSAEALAHKIHVSRRHQGETSWSEVSPGEDNLVNVDCSTPAGQVEEYLITSTEDTSNQVLGTLVFKDMRLKECKCKDLDQPLDPCLKGNWVLDDQALSAYYTKTFKQFQRTDVSGKATFKISTAPNTKSSALFEQWRVYILEATGDDGGILDQEATANGTLDLKFLMQKKGEFCIRPSNPNGTYKQIFAGQTLDGSLADIMVPDPSSPEQHIQYYCDAKQLMLTIGVGDFALVWPFVKQ